MDIKFKYSHIYELSLNPDAALIPTEKINSTVAELEQFWKDFGPVIERTFKEVTGLSFVEKKISCYLNSTQSFSDPLTMQIEDIADMKDTLVHELVHQLLIQNESSFMDGWNALFERFKDEEPITKTHIAVHAIHLLVAEKIFQDRIKVIRTYSKQPAYVKSWEIIDREGADKIITSVFGVKE